MPYNVEWHILSLCNIAVFHFICSFISHGFSYLQSETLNGKLQNAKEKIVSENLQLNRTKQFSQGPPNDVSPKDTPHIQWRCHTIILPGDVASYYSL